MKTARRAFAALGVIAALVYAGAMLWLVSQETELVFHATANLGEARPSTPWEQVAEIPAWILPASKIDESPWILFLHGNSSDLSTKPNIQHYERLRQLGINVLAPEYRGFGGLAGVPTEASLAEDAHRAYSYLRDLRHIDPKRIVIYGWSLGSAVAVTLASQVEEAALILEAAPASVVEVGQRRYPYFPVRLLIRNPFESILRIDKINAPVFFLHSPEDSTIPIAEARRLFDAALEPKHFVEVMGGHVYSSQKDPRFFPAIRTFLQGLNLLT